MTAWQKTLSGNTSLRAAIQEANASLGFDTITLGPGIYTLTLTGAGEDSAATGDLDITDQVHIFGAGADTTIIDASALGDRAFDVFSNQFAGLTGVTITGGSGVGLANNSDGGAIRNQGQLWVEASTLDTNSSNNEGGAIRNLLSGTVNIVDSTLSNNTARRGGGLHTQGAATVTSSTFSGNSTFASFTTPSRGGAIYVNGTTTTIESSTLTDNTADEEAGGLYVETGVALTSNTVIAGNFSTTTSDIDVSGLIGSQGYTLIGDIGTSANVGGGVGNQIGDSAGSGAIDPLLGPLADNGGTTLTHVPLVGSPLIDARWQHWFAPI